MCVCVCVCVCNTLSHTLFLSISVAAVLSVSLFLFFFCQDLNQLMRTYHGVCVSDTKIPSMQLAFYLALHLLCLSFFFSLSFPGHHIISCLHPTTST